MAIKAWFGRESKVLKQIEHAERLVESQQYLEAIDILSDLNASSPSGQIEARLIQLRHEALFHLQPTSSIKEWPPVAPALFSNDGGIPEVHHSELTTEKLRSAILNNGSLIVRNLITERVAQETLGHINTVFENYDAATSGEPLEKSAPWFVPFKPSDNLGEHEFSTWSPNDRGSRYWVREGGGVLAAESPRMFEHIIAMLRNNSVLSIIEAYLGERPALSVKKTTLRRVPSTLDTANGWHQDGAFLGEGIRTVNLWIALTDCGVDAPTMDMVPKRLQEIVPTGTHSAAFDWSVAREVVDQYSEGSAPVRLQFKAGDAILFDEMNLHCTAVAPGMTKDRFAIEAWFFAPSCYPMDQLPLLI